MPASVNVILKDQIVGVNRILLIVIIEDEEKIPAFEVRIEDERAVVVPYYLGVGLRPYLRETPPRLVFEIYSSHIHKDTSEVLLFWNWLESTIVHLLVLENLPKTFAVFFLVF